MPAQLTIPGLTDEQKRPIETSMSGVEADALLYLGPSAGLTRGPQMADIDMDLDYRREIERRARDVFRYPLPQRPPSGCHQRRTASRNNCSHRRGNEQTIPTRRSYPRRLSNAVIEVVSQIRALKNGSLRWNASTVARSEASNTNKLPIALLPSSVVSGPCHYNLYRSFFRICQEIFMRGVVLSARIFRIIITSSA